MRTVGVVTVARSDYGLYRPLLDEIRAHPKLHLHLIVGGMHLSPRFGMTIEEIRQDGFEVSERIEMLVSSDTPEGVSKSMGLGTIAFAQVYGRLELDLLMVLGDRFEMHSAALAALPFKIPIAHIHGGETTRGAIDDALRHSITKMSHLHFPSTQEYARRLRQLGEEPWRITVAGALSLDSIRTTQLLTLDQLQKRHGLELEKQFLLVTYHPVTLQYEQTAWQVEQLLSALETCGVPVLFTLPNADTGGRIIIQKIRDFVAKHPSSQVASSLGSRSYFSALALASALVGNSSSGIVEAACFGLPVVNVGMRQEGRMRSANILDVGNSKSEVLTGIRKALSEEFRKSLGTMTSPYGDGHAARRIVQRLGEVELDDRLIIKRFIDLPTSEVRSGPTP